jgi:hypothetical protein
MHKINLRHLFFFLLLTLTLASSAWSADGRACLPNGFNSFSSINPNVINLKPTISSDELLSTQTVSDSFSTTCISDSTAELGFVFVENSLFVNSQAGFFAADVNLLEETPTRIRVGYALRSRIGDVFSTAGSPYSLYINYYISISCAGGLSYVRKSNDEFRIRGINSAACNGNYSMTYKYEIYQNKEAALKSGYFSANTGTGFVLRSSLYRNSSIATPQNTLATLIPSSNATVFQTNLSCIYSVSPSTIDLGSLANTSIFLANVRSRNFFINASNCTNTSGGGRNHKIFVTFKFGAVDAGDATILTNNRTGSNAAVNVGLSLSCTFDNGEFAVQNNNLNLMKSIASVSNSIPCSVFMVPTSNVTNPNQIRPGSFNATATLTFIFN